MYHVIIIGIIAIILYFLTFTGYKFGVITKKAHRDFWNTILLITFFIAASAGIFLALQSNYKWDIRGVEKILNWHVDFGIALSFTALVHLTWHLGYYKKLLKSSQEKDNTNDSPQGSILTAGNFRIMLMLLGYMSGTVQVIFLREILNLSGGYEVAAGAVFACWIIVSALGVKLAGKGRSTNTLTLTAILPLASIISLVIYIILSKILIKEGVTPGIIYTLIITGISLIPFCFLSGYLFVRLSYHAKRETSLLPGNSFAVETTGSMLAGILVTVLTGNILGNYQIFIISILVYYIILLITGKFRFYRLLTVIASLCMVAVIIFKPDTYIRNILLSSVKVIKSIDSKYGNIAVSEYEGEKSIFYDHRLIDYEQDAKEREEDIHYAMVQQDNPEDILIISGGIDKHIQEVLKYSSVKSITYLERDPELIACTRDTTIKYSGAEVMVVNDDAFSYIRRSTGKFDVIISLLSKPDNIVTNRFYTQEYFRYLKEILNSDGIFMLKAGTSSSYISEEESGFLSTIYNSLKGVFSYILPIKGESVYLLCSDEKLKTDIPELINERGVENTYVNSYYLNNEIIKFNSEQVSAVIDSSLQKNILDKPVAVFYSQKHHLEKTGDSRLFIILIICLLLLIPFFTGNNSGRTMYSTSLNLAGTEIMALILIQSTAGNFYQLAGLLIAVVMGGLAIGSSSRLNMSIRLVDMISALLGLLAVLFALLSHSVLTMRNVNIPVIISLLIVLIPAIMAGYYYRRKTEGGNNSGIISGIYFADLCGAALGFMIIAGILVPLYGIKMTFYILAFINFASYITNRVISGIRKLIQQKT
jgi:spermidine synthase